MQVSLACLAAVVSAILSTTHAHMIMKTPTPYGKSTLNNSPLAADGSDFPCKQRPGVYDADGASNTMAIGSKQTLSFTGTAVHGGGSCQISLTTDKAPTAKTQWQVIHSIEGGCPARNQDGNLPEGGNDPDTYTFTIPDGIAPGEYTLAWTWFNRIGNREMYMNCAPVTVTGGSSKVKRAVEHRKEQLFGFMKRAATFPGMFLANIGNGCTTADSKDLKFPDPGSSLEMDGVAANLAPPVGNCGAAAPAGGASSGASSAAAAAPSATSAASTPAASSPAVSSSAAAATSPVAASPAASSPVSAAASAAAAASPPAGSAAAPSPAAASPTAAASPASTPAAGGSAAGALSGPCTPEGQWNCLGGTSFQRCASGQWSVVQPMAAGVQCTAGQSLNLAMNAIA